MRRIFAAIGFLLALAAGQQAHAAVTCPLPYILQQGTIPNAVQVMADFYALQGCIQSGGGGGGTGVVVDCATNPGACPYDIEFFWAGAPPASQVVRPPFDRSVTCPAGFGASVAIAKVGATGAPVVTINKVTAGTPTAIGTITWSGTAGTFAAAAASNFLANDIVEFVFPASPDATLADVSVMLKCNRVQGQAVASSGAPLNSGHIFVGNAINLAADVAMSGDVSIATGGATTVLKVHGVTYPAAPSVGQVPIATGSSAVIYGLVPNSSLVNAATTVNGQVCTLGSTCTVTAAATGVTVGTTTVGGGTSGRVLYDAAGILGEMTTTGSGTVLALATSPTIASPTVTGAFTATGLVTLADHATQGANTVIANVTAGTASPTAAALPSCVDTAGNHLNYTNGTGFSCGTSGGASGSIVVGTTTISSGTSGRVLYDAAGVLGEMTTSGSGTVLALAASPSISALTVTGSFTATGLVTAADLFGTTGSGGNVVLATAPTVSALTVTGSLTATGLITNADLANASTTVNGQTCTLGSTCTITAAATGITVGTTTVGGGTTGRVLYDNAGVLGEMTTSGSGTVLALAASPSISALTVTGSFTATGLVTAADLFGTTGSGGNVVLATSPSISGLTVTSSFTATGLVTNADLVNAATTVNGQTCTLGSTCTITAAATGITVGTTTIGSSTSGRLLYDNAGVLGEPIISASSGALTVGTTTGPTAGSITMAGSTSGSLQVKPAAIAGSSSVLTLPGGTTDFSATGGTNNVVKQASAGAAFTVGTLACANLSDGATGCSTATGTSGATIPLLNGTNTWSAVQTFGNGQITPNNAVVATLLATGTSVSLTGPREYYVCTGTCTVTPPVPVAGYEFCVMNDDNVATAITLAALGSSAMYENTARTAYGTAGTGTLVSTAAAASKVCIVGRDSTHYLTTTYTGTWTAS